MARTKRVKREVRTAIASFRIINRTSFIKRWLNVDKDNFQLERGPGQANPITVVPGRTTQNSDDERTKTTPITLYSIGEGGSVVTSIDFLLKNSTLVLVQNPHDNKLLSTRITVKDGDDIILVDNPQNPPLTLDNVDQIYRYIQRYRETAALQYSHEELWDKIGTLIGRKDSSVEALTSLYNSALSDYRDPRWFQIYDPLVPECQNSNELSKMIQNKPFILHAYWRALDREPGGNASYLTIRYAFHLHPNKPHSVRVYVARNFDGENDLEGPFTPVAVRVPHDTDTESLYDTILSLILRQGGNDQINNTFHIIDEISQDREEYDTEWSSVEMLVFTTEQFDLQKCSNVSPDLRKQIKTFLLCLKRQHKNVTLPLELTNRIASFLAPPRPIFRLHQQCLMGSQFRNTLTTTLQPQHPIAGTSTQLELINLLTDIVGIGRVNQVDWQSSGDTDAEGPEWCAKEDFQTTRPTQSLGVGYEFPIMFRWPS